MKIIPFLAPEIRPHRGDRPHCYSVEFEALRDRTRLSLRRAEDRFLVQWQKTRGQSRNPRAISLLGEQWDAILFARMEAEAQERHKDLRRTRSILVARKWKAIDFLERHGNRLMMHHRVKGLPPTTNIAES